ncbi:unnamed protein product [Adineta ricciae]|uniref:Uncharacterized protein n=1 Tax=Adineta ricciae TaxID=249248 RepID=A0A816FK63_ADIRI|nr:unnamed protein product [Adineta ricciae]
MQQWSTNMFSILVLLFFKSTTADRDCLYSFGKTCSLGTSVWCCPFIKDESIVACGKEIGICVPIPIKDLYPTTPHHTQLDPSPLPIGLRILLGVIGGTCGFVAILCQILIIIHNCGCCTSKISEDNQQKRLNLNDFTQDNKELSVSTISVLFDALPPSYDISIDKDLHEVSPPSYDIVTTGFKLDAQPSLKTISIEDVILHV